MEGLEMEMEVTKWKDNPDVCVITKAFIPDFVESVIRNGKSKLKSNILHIYN